MFTCNSAGIHVGLMSTRAKRLRRWPETGPRKGVARYGYEFPQQRHPRERFPSVTLTGDN